MILKRLLLITAVSLFLFSGCARSPQETLQTPEEAQTQWETYAKTANPLTKPYRISMSLRFGEEGNTRRVTALLWGNSEKVLRLDVRAGVGAHIASITDIDDHFLVFSPRENIAYEHTGSNKPLLKVGVPLPFTLSQLATLLEGHFARVFGTQYNHAQYDTFKSPPLLQYTLDSKRGGRLLLDKQSRPVQWDENEKKGWQMTLGYEDDAALVPYKLTLEHPQGKRAIVLVKERERPQAPFDEKQLRIDVPTTVEILPLEKFRQLKDQ